MESGPTGVGSSYPLATAQRTRVFEDANGQKRTLGVPNEGTGGRSAADWDRWAETVIWLAQGNYGSLPGQVSQ